MKNCKKGVKTVTIALIVCAIVLCDRVSFAQGDCSAEDYSAEMEKRLFLFAEEYMNYLAEGNLESEYKNTLVPVQIKMAHDFAGNLYYVIEYSPSGYIIYNEETGVVAEASVLSESPYKGYKNELYYGGPCSYVVKDDKSQGYIDLFSNCVTQNLPEENSPAFLKCQIVQESLKKCSDESIKDYIRFGHHTQEKSQPRNGGISIVNPGGGTNSSYTYVSYRSYISSLSSAAQMGYAEDTSTNPSTGLCGWIACGIVILWHQNYTSTSMISTNNVVNKRFVNSDFTWLLRSYGNSSSTIASDLKKAISTYASTKNKPIFATTGWSTVSSIINSINLNRPIVSGGLLWNPHNDKMIMHYVVVYGYSDTHFVCHYGWPGYSQVYVSRGLNMIWGDYVRIGNTVQ